jgi:hypothetical protein
VIAQSVQHWTTGWRIGVLGFDSRRGLGIFLFITASRTARLWGPPSLSNGYQGLFRWGVKRPGCETDTHLHLVPRSRMQDAITPLPQYVFMAWCLVKHRDNFSVTFDDSKKRVSVALFVEFGQRFSDANHSWNRLLHHNYIIQFNNIFQHQTKRGLF